MSARKIMLPVAMSNVWAFFAGAAAALFANGWISGDPEYSYIMGTVAFTALSAGCQLLAADRLSRGFWIGGRW